MDKFISHDSFVSDTELGALPIEGTTFIGDEQQLRESPKIVDDASNEFTFDLEQDKVRAIHERSKKIKPNYPMNGKR